MENSMAISKEIKGWAWWHMPIIPSYWEGRD
jgi:hypothetical protein